MKKIYLDYAAATPLSSTAQKAMEPYFGKMFFNASAAYLSAKRVSSDIQAARARVAKVLGARPSEIIFTAGGTEANNLAISGVMESFKGGKLVISSVEHDSILAPAEKYESVSVDVKRDGTVDIDDLVQRIDDNTVLVSIIYANNEIGTVQPLADIARQIESIRASRRKKGIRLPLFFHTDACQAGNYLHLLVDKLGVDIMTLNAGKLYGPKQTGALYVKTGTSLKPQILGGGQERGMRSGTENTSNIIGFATALDEAQSMRTSEAKRLAKLRELFISSVLSRVNGAELTADPARVLPNNVHLTIAGQDNERLMMALDEKGIMCAVGSACSASSDDPSHVLKAIGLSDETARSSLRFTLGRFTSEKDIKQTVNVLAALTKA